MIRAIAISVALAACGEPSPGAKDPELAPPQSAPFAGKSFADRCPGDARNESDQGIRYAVSGIHQQPFHAVAKIKLSNSAVCSGVLIDEQTILTAAHCFEDGALAKGVSFTSQQDEERHDYQAVTVTLNAAYKKKLYQGHRLRSHPDMASYDRATIRLNRPVAGIQPATMASMSVKSGQRLALVGYGDTGRGIGIKRFAQTHVGRMIEHYETASHGFENLMLLDSHSGSGACPGDSGGGVFRMTEQGYKLVGIVSGINDVLYPGLPVDGCRPCPQGLGVITLVEDSAPFP